MLTDNSAEGNMDEKMNPLIHVNIPMALKFREECKKFAKSRNQTMASMVRDAVRELMKKELPLNPPQSEIMQKLSNLENLYAQKNAEQSLLLKRLAQQTNSNIDDAKIEEIKGKILDILEYNPKGLHYKELAEKCKIREETLLKLIGELQKSDILEFKANRVTMVR